MWFGFAAEKEWQNAREKEQAAIAKETELQSTIKSAQKLLTGGVEKAVLVIIDDESDADDDIFAKPAGGSGRMPLQLQLLSGVFWT